MARPSPFMKHLQNKLILVFHRPGISKSEIGRRLKIDCTSVRRVLAAKKS
jgi:hypothetical protein